MVLIGVEQSIQPVAFVSQRLPVYPEEHMQLKSSTSGWHVAKFKHGFPKHISILVSHSLPVKSKLHLQVNESTADIQTEFMEQGFEIQ